MTRVIFINNAKINGKISTSLVLLIEIILLYFNQHLATESLTGLSEKKKDILIIGFQ